MIQVEKLTPVGKANMAGSQWGNANMATSLKRKCYCTKTVEPSASNLPSIIHMPGALWSRVDKQCVLFFRGLKNG